VRSAVGRYLGISRFPSPLQLIEKTSH